MSYIGNQPIPGFLEFRRELEKAPEAAEIELSTISRAVFKPKRGEIQFGNGVLTFPHGGKTAVVPFHAVDHFLVGKS